MSFVIILIERPLAAEITCCAFNILRMPFFVIQVCLAVSTRADDMSKTHSNCVTTHNMTERTGLQKGKLTHGVDESLS